MKQVDSRGGMLIAEDHEDKGIVIANPFFPFGRVGEILERDRQHRPIAQSGESGNCSVQIAWLEFHDQVHVLREANMAMRNDGQSTHNEIAHVGSIQSTYDCFNAALFHSSILSPHGGQTKQSTAANLADLQLIHSRDRGTAVTRRRAAGTRSLSVG